MDTKAHEFTGQNCAWGKLKKTNYQSFTQPRLESPGGFAGDSSLHLEEAGVNSGRVDAPSGGQQRNFIGVQRGDIRLAESRWFGLVEIIKTLKAKFFFGGRRGSLRPNRFSRPCVPPNNPTAVSFDPGMIVQDTAGAEELDPPHFAAQFKQETETDIDVIARFGQPRADHQDPALDGRRNEQLFFAGQPLDQRTGFGIVQSQGGLDRERVAAFNGQPGTGPSEGTRVFLKPVR